MNLCHHLLFISIAVIVTVIMIKHGRLIPKLMSITGFFVVYYQHHIFAASGWITVQNCKLLKSLLKSCSLERNNHEKYVGDIIFIGRWLFMGVMLYTPFNVKSWKTDNESDDKLFNYKNGNMWLY